MNQCSGIKRDGGRCTTVVSPPLEFCYQHDPARETERRRNASKAGKARPSRELQDIKTRLSQLADDVLEGRADRGRAAVAGQILNVYIRAVSVESKVKELEELEQRIERLEQRRIA